MSKKVKFLRVIILFLGINNVVSAAPGDLDTTFDGDGIILTTIGNSTFNEATGVVIQPDGKSVISINSVGSAFDSNLARFNPNGSLDTAFGNNGIVSSPFGMCLISKDFTPCNSA